MFIANSTKYNVASLSDITVPAEWEIVSLPDYVFFQEGPGLRYWQFKTNGMKVINVTNIIDGQLDLTRTTRHIDLIEFKQKYLHFGLETNDIVVSSSGSIGKVATVAKKDLPLMLNTSVIRFKPLNEQTLDRKFLLYFLSSSLFERQISVLTTGAAQKNFGPFHLKQIKLFKPKKITEQQKIASILSKVDELIQKTYQIIKQTERLRKGVMNRLLTKGIGHTKFKITELGEIPEEWVVSSIGAKCRLGTGGTPNRSNLDYFKGEIPWVKTTEINFNKINSTDEKITIKAIEESSAKVYPKGSLLMAMYGEGSTRGRTAILEIDAAINQACAAIQSLGEISIPFLFYWCQYNYENIRRISQGTHQSNLNLEYVSKIKIPIPSLEEQKSIENILDRFDSTLKIRNFHLSKLSLLKKGLMQKLLTGKIRVKV